MHGIEPEEPHQINTNSSQINTEEIEEPQQINTSSSQINTTNTDQSQTNEQIIKRPKTIEQRRPISSGQAATIQTWKRILENTP